MGELSTPLCGSVRTPPIRENLTIPPTPRSAPRTLNPAAANLYNSLFAGEAGQRVVANNDIIPTLIPESDDYTFTLQGFHIVGNGTSNSTYGYSVRSLTLFFSERSDSGYFRN